MIRELACGCVIEDDRELLRLCRRVKASFAPVSAERGSWSSVIVMRLVYSAPHFEMRKGQYLRINKELVV